MNFAKINQKNLNIPIAMLHHVTDEPHPTLKKWCISHNKFLEFLDSIEQKGYLTTTFQEIVTSQFKPEELTNRIIITFDDCAAELFEFAIPELVKRKMKAVFYMPSNQIDGHNIWDIEELGIVSVKLMSAAQLQKLLALGMEVGSHGEKHVRLNTVDGETALTDIKNSKTKLEKVLNHAIYSFAYPYGMIPANHKQMLLKAGYQFGLAIYSTVQTKFTLRRFAINEWDDQNKIQLKLSRTYRIMRSLYDPLFILKNRIFKA